MPQTPAERRAILINALRNEMPANHEWDFGTYLEPRDCGSIGCAIGVAHLLWPDTGLLEHDSVYSYTSNDEVIAEFLGITELEVNYIFYSSHLYPSLRPLGITPQMVADQLESIER